MGNLTTSEDELRVVGNSLLGKSFKGVFPVDKLPPLKQGQCCIINLDRSGMPGSHWVAIHKSIMSNQPTYCVHNSFGRKSSNILRSLRQLRIQDSDYDAEQRVEQDNCGHHSICWLWCVQKLGIKNAMKI